MSDTLYRALINCVCFIGGAMVILPAIVYLFTGWSARRERIMSTLDARALYFPSIDISGDSNQQLCKRFAEHYGKRYGRC